jgi:hypothetical protein
LAVHVAGMGEKRGSYRVLVGIRKEKCCKFNIGKFKIKKHCHCELC